MLNITFLPSMTSHKEKRMRETFYDIVTPGGEGYKITLKKVKW